MIHEMMHLLVGEPLLTSSGNVESQRQWEFHRGKLNFSSQYVELSREIATDDQKA